LDNNIEAAGALLFSNNPLSLICSYICPQESQCEGHCVLGIKGTPVQISEIEQYISDYYLNVYKPQRDCEESKGKVAVIGSGPAGITISFLLAKKGYDVTIFEGNERIGGVMWYGIPDFRLPRSVLIRLKKIMTEYGIVVRPNTTIGTNITIDDLQRDGFKSIFIGTGVWRPSKLGLKGESLGHVHYAIDYLRNPDVYTLGNRVAVIGAGNTAMDVARTVIRHGSREVTLIFNRGEEDITARKVETEYAYMDGAKMLFYKASLEFTDKGVIIADSVVDENGDVHAVEGTETLFEADSVIIAVGQGPRTVIVDSTKGIDVNNRGLVAVDDCGRTTKEGVFASGDVVTGAKTVVAAVKVSRRVAEAMDEYMQSLK
jgi:glutamate synthase (NADPH/NADH) small chain